MRKKVLTRLLFFVSCAFTCIVFAAPVVQSRTAEPETKALQFGMLPFLSPHALMKVFNPLLVYLEHRLDRPVHASTAPDFKTYVKRTSEGYYDLYHTAPHFAAQAKKKYGHRPLVRYARDLYGVIVVRKDSSITRIEDLKGATLAAPPRKAIIAMLGELTFKEHGLEAGKDFVVKYTPSHNTAMIAVVNGRAEVAVAGAPVYEYQPPEVKSKLRVLAKTREIPGSMYVARSGLPDEEYKKLKDAMEGFTADAGGKEFFANSNYGDIIPVTEEDMKRLEPILILFENRN